jgi:hypothetical protein
VGRAAITIIAILAIVTIILPSTARRVVADTTGIPVYAVMTVIAFVTTKPIA